MFFEYTLVSNLRIVTLIITRSWFAFFRLHVVVLGGAGSAFCPKFLQVRLGLTEVLIGANLGRITAGWVILGLCLRLTG